jgi:hypothetical protein
MRAAQHDPEHGDHDGAEIGRNARLQAGHRGDRDEPHRAEHPWQRQGQQLEQIATGSTDRERQRQPAGVDMPRQGQRGLGNHQTGLVARHRCLGQRR